MTQTIEATIEYTSDGRPTGVLYVNGKKYTHPATDLEHLPNFDLSKGKLVPLAEANIKLRVRHRIDIQEAPGASTLTCTVHSNRTGKRFSTVGTAA